MKLKDVPQPPDACKDLAQISADGLWVIGRLSVLIAVDNPRGVVKYGDRVAWGAEYMVGRLIQDNSAELPIVYQKPVPSDEAEISNPITNSVARQYDNGKFVIGLTKTSPFRLPNHMSLAKGDRSPTHGYVALSRPTEPEGNPGLYFWPLGWLTEISEKACQRLALANFAVQHELPQELFNILYGWKVDVNQSVINSQPFQLA